MRRTGTNALADAFYYSTKVGHKWDPKEFFESGDRDCQLFVDPIIKELGIEPGNLAVLELECGVGRMTKALAAASAPSMQPTSLPRWSCPAPFAPS